MPLPIVDPTRVEYNFRATTCGCDACKRYCRHMPGFLVPADLVRLFGFLGLGASLEEFAEKYLLASPGATALTGGGIVKIPTLVPKRKEDGSCYFLTEGGQCGIHAVAPFGCRFFDDHMSQEEGDRRATEGLIDIMANKVIGGDYTRMWRHLHALGLDAPHAREGRAAMDKPILPFEPQLAYDLYQRFDAALEPIVTEATDVEGRLAYRPGEHRQHVFEFNDGTRLIVSHDKQDGCGDVLHFSASIHTETPLYRSTLAAIRRDPHAALHNALADFIMCFRRISGYSGPLPDPVMTPGKGVPHWFIPWEEFQANRTKEPPTNG